MRPSSAGAISCLSICSSLGLHAGQVAQVLFSEIAGDDSVDLAHGIADTGEGGGVRLKDRLPDGAGQIELAALIGKIIPQAGGEITGIEKAAAEGPLEGLSVTNPRSSSVRPVSPANSAAKVRSCSV